MGFTAAVLGGLTLGYQVYSGEQQRRQQKKQLRMQEQANADARKQAKEAADRADVEMNKANRKRADVSAIQSKEEQAAKGGVASTMLTGAQGINPDQYNLGGNTLLGS